MIWSPDVFPFLAQLGPQGRAEAQQLRVRSAERGAQLIRRGDSAGGAVLVVRGSLRAYYLTESGREATLYRVTRGGTCVLALSSTVTQQPYPAWVDVGPDGAELVRIDESLLLGWLEREPEFRRYVFTVLLSQVFELMMVLEEAGSLMLEERLVRWLLRQADGTGLVRTTQAALAAELGTAREVISRALRDLAAAQLLTTGRGWVQVIARQALEARVPRSR